MKDVRIEFAFGTLIKSNEGLSYKENFDDYKNAYFPGEIMLKIGDNEVTGGEHSKQGFGYFGDYPLVEFLAWLKIMTICDDRTLKCFRTEGPDFILFELIDKDIVMVIHYWGGEAAKIVNSDTIQLTKLVPAIIEAGDSFESHVLEIDQSLSDEPDMIEFHNLLEKLKSEWSEYQKQLY